MTTPEQHERIWLSSPHMSGRERELLLDAFDSNWIAPLGPHVDGLEKEFAETVGMDNAVALASGTSALHLALQLVGVKPGDDVITSSFTFVATANAIEYCHANPVFLDSDLRTWNMDPNLLEDELKQCKKDGRMPAAVLTVDVNGQCCDYDPIVEICNRFEIPLIEDAAEALGAKYKNRPAGQFGKLACFSFNGNKIITTSGGGMLVTENKEWADKARFLSTQARDPAPHYQHSHVGYNYRMSNLLAAVGRGQLEVLDNRVASRRANFEFYKDQFADLDFIEFMPEPEGFYSTRWLTAMKIDPAKAGIDREHIRLALAEKNIESRPLWKHMQPVFAHRRMRGGNVCESLFEDGLCLPSGSNLSTADLEQVVSTFKESLS
jgi:dTDP-4-amino-4,6-dideoxygalactose transaminase